MGEFMRVRLPAPVSFFEAEGLTLTGTGKWETPRCDFLDLLPARNGH